MFIIAIDANKTSQGLMSISIVGGLIGSIIIAALAFSSYFIFSPLYFGYGTPLYIFAASTFIFFIAKRICHKKAKDSGKIAKSLLKTSIICSILSLAMICKNTFIIVPSIESGIKIHKFYQSLGHDNYFEKKKKTSAQLEQEKIVRDSSILKIYPAANSPDYSKSAVRLGTLAKDTYIKSSKDLKMARYTLSCVNEDYSLRQTFRCQNVLGIKLFYGLNFQKIVLEKNADINTFRKMIDIPAIINDHNVEQSLKTLNPVSCGMNLDCIVLGKAGVRPFASHIHPNDGQIKLLSAIENEGPKSKKSISAIRPHKSYWRLPLKDPEGKIKICQNGRAMCRENNKKN